MRGLDYYNRTVFEWVTDRLGAQGTVAGGGRYDGLFEQLGGKPTPACGFAIGIERMILLLAGRAAHARVARRSRTSCTPATARRRSRARVAEALRDAGHARRRQRGRRQLQVADEEGRRERRALRAHHRRRRGRRATRSAIKPLRERGEQIAVPARELARALARCRTST